MRRADRLFQIIQILRRAGGPITAMAIAEELEVSRRSVYRDIADLMAQRVPIRGEAGIGYVLERGYDMPPLMLTPAEVEAAVLGAQWVAERGDPELARAARDLIAKIAAAIPDRLQPLIDAPVTQVARSRHAEAASRPDVARLRRAIREGHKIRIEYRDKAGSPSERTIRPTLVGYVETVEIIAAWCELRQAFRHFRLDRIGAIDFTGERHGRRPAALRLEWKRVFEAERGTRPA